MEVRTCRGCGKLYNYLGSTTPACPSCMQILEEKFQTCKEYIRANPGANMQQVADDTEVSIKMIKQWVREERLTFTEGSCVGIECESCGANILTGRYCASCKGKLQQTLINMSRTQKQQPPQNKQVRDPAKMRFLDNNTGEQH